MKSVVKSALVLTAIAFVAGILLAVVHKFTYQPYVFSLTAEDKTAISSITDTKKFDYIEHMSIKANATVRVVLRGTNGADNNNILIRAYGIGYNEGTIDTYTLVDATTGNIKKVAYVEHDPKNTFFSKIDLEKFCKSMEGRVNLGKFDKNIDGTAGATISSNGLYDSVKNAINYYTDNAAAIKSAKSSGIVDMDGAVEDKLLTAIKKLYPDAKSQSELSVYDAKTYTIKIYMTDKGAFVFSYKGTVTYTYEEHEESYQSEILMKIGADGKIDGKPVYYTGDFEDYFDTAVDGSAGATGSTSFIDTAIAAVEAYYGEHNAALIGQTDVKHIFTLGTGRYIAIVSGKTVPIDEDEGHFEEYNFVLAVKFDNGVKDGIKLVSTEDYENYMDDGIDGTAGATRSEFAVDTAVAKAKTIVEGL